MPIPLTALSITDGDNKLRNHPNADEHYFFTDTMLGLGNYYVEAGVEQ